MNWLNQAHDDLRRVLDYQLADIGGTAITVAAILVFFALVVASFSVSKMGQKAIGRAGRSRGLDPGTIAVVQRLGHYLTLAVGFTVALQSLGIDLSALFAAGAVFAVGLGFAMQTMAENFVAGLILLAERTIKPGDILEIGGRVMRVDDMTIRSTIVRTLDGEQVIVPNSELVKNQVVNLTLNDKLYRVRVNLGVSYNADQAHVRRVLSEVGRTYKGSVQTMPIKVRLMGFGASSVDWQLCVWIDDPFERQDHLDALFQSLWDALAHNAIVISYPQLDLHLDPSLTAALTGRQGTPPLPEQAVHSGPHEHSPANP